MKNDLTCGVVRDLLPSYVEGLTSEETNTAVEAHLAACPDCAARKDAMTAPEAPPEREETAKEVDYLKTVKRRNRRRVILAVLSVVLIIAAGFAAKIYLIGTPAQAQSYTLRAYADEENVLHLVIDGDSPDYAYKNWEVEEQDGVVSVYGRMVTASPLHKEAWGRLLIPLDGVDEVWLCGELVWQDGMVISGWTRACLEARTPYVGNAPAVGQVLETLNIPNMMGAYTMSLQTSSAPYGCTLEFKDPFSAIDPVFMENYAIMLLALVDNLQTVTWTYPESKLYGPVQTRTVTLEEGNAMVEEWMSAYIEKTGADWTVLDSVKSYTSSAADFERLHQILWVNAQLNERAGIVS
nr:DUF4825 domain-containing protein [uncultured Oscillibacter sp.]